MLSTETHRETVRGNLTRRISKDSLSIPQVFWCSLEAKFTIWSRICQYLQYMARHLTRSRINECKIKMYLYTGLMAMCIYSHLFMLHTVPWCPHAGSLYIQYSVCAAAVGIHMICSHWPLQAAWHDSHSDSWEQKATLNTREERGRMWAKEK